MDEQDLIYCIVYPLCILAIRSTSTFHFGILPYVFSCINYCCWPHSCCCNGGKMYLCRSAVFTLVLLLQSLIMGKHKTHYWWLHYSMQYSPDFSKTLKVVFSRHGLQWIEYTFFPQSHCSQRQFNIPDVFPSVHRALPRGPFLPLIDEKNLPKTGSESRTPGFTFYSQAHYHWAMESSL